MVSCHIQFDSVCIGRSCRRIDKNRHLILLFICRIEGNIRLRAGNDIPLFLLAVNILPEVIAVQGVCTHIGYLIKAGRDLSCGICLV